MKARCIIAVKTTADARKYEYTILSHQVLCKLTAPLSTAPLVILSACFATQDKWQWPELPWQEQHPLISG
jgi:hypothetical protein